MRTRLVLLSVATGAALLAIRIGLDARAQAPFSAANRAAPAAKRPMTPRAAKTWEMLERDTEFGFANETPLEEVLKYIKAATTGPNDSGIPLYVDPVGLQEAEKTMTSPIAIDLEKIPLKSGLELMLKQLGMRFFVRDDGIVVITSVDYDDSLAEAGPDIAQALRDLTEQIAALRQDLSPNEAARVFIKRSEIEAQIGELRNVILEMRESVRTVSKDR